MATYTFGGQTTAGCTEWQKRDETSLRLIVDTCEADFQTPNPIYICSLGGHTGHWTTIGDVHGGNAIYDPKQKSFKVIVRRADGALLSPKDANNWKWHINWIGFEERPD